MTIIYGGLIQLPAPDLRIIQVYCHFEGKDLQTIDLKWYEGNPLKLSEYSQEIEISKDFKMTIEEFSLKEIMPSLHRKKLYYDE